MMNNDELQGNPSEQLNNNQGVRRWILLGILAAAIIGCLVGSILLIRHYNDPMLTAGDYYDAVARKEWDRLYEMLDVGEDGHFLTRESYFAVMEEQFRDMDKYSIHREGNHVFRMDYVVAGREHATTILLKEQEKKEYLFFRQYTIQPLDLLAENISIIVPNDITVCINGTELGEEYLDETGAVAHATYETVYTLPRMYIGTYTLAQYGENFQTCTDEIEIGASNVIIRPALPYLNSGVIENLGEEAAGLIRLEYEAMIAGNDSGNGADRGKAYSDVNISGLNTRIQEYGYTDDGLTVSLAVTYHVDTALLTRLTDSYTEMDYYREQMIQKDEERTYLFVYKNRNWLLYDAD